MGGDLEAWSTIESDPGLFTELIQDFGVRGVQVDELYALDPETLAALGPIYGLIFLFKWDKKLYEKSSKGSATASDLDAPPSPSLYFAQQVVHNACGTQAILNILMNIRDKDVDLGDALRHFKEFTLDFSPEMRGHAIGSHDLIKTKHNAYGKPAFLELLEEKANQKKGAQAEDVFHFCAYVQMDGGVYELDGLKPGPVRVGTVQPDQEWTAVAAQAIQDRIALFSSEEIRFNLMAVVHDRLAAMDAALKTPPADPEAAQALAMAADMERERRAEFRQDNVLRRHNFLPLIFAMLAELDGTEAKA